MCSLSRWEDPLRNRIPHAPQRRGFLAALAPFDEVQVSLGVTFATVREGRQHGSRLGGGALGRGWFLRSCLRPSEYFPLASVLGSAF